MALYDIMIMILNFEEEKMQKCTLMVTFHSESQDHSLINSKIAWSADQTLKSSQMIIPQGFLLFSSLVSD